MALGGLVIEPMQRRDLRRGVMAIEAVSYPRPWSQGVFESELAQVRGGTRRYLVARRIDGPGKGRGPLVGYAGLWFSGDEAHVTNMAVEPAQQRTGVATRAAGARSAEAAIERGCSAWTLEVRVSSVGAQELYRRFGFNPAGFGPATTRTPRTRSSCGATTSKARTTGRGSARSAPRPSSGGPDPPT